MVSDIKYWLATIAAILMAMNFYTDNQNGIIIFGFLMIGALLTGNEE